jgi:hypothetical protein
LLESRSSKNADIFAFDRFHKKKTPAFSMFVSIIHALNFQFFSKETEIYDSNALKTVRDIRTEEAT